MITREMLLFVFLERPKVNNWVCRFIFIKRAGPESDLTEHLVTQQFHNTKVAKVIWRKRVFTKWTVG